MDIIFVFPLMVLINADNVKAVDNCCDTEEYSSHVPSKYVELTILKIEGAIGTIEPGAEVGEVVGCELAANELL